MSASLCMWLVALELLKASESPCLMHVAIRDVAMTHVAETRNCIINVCYWEEEEEGE